MIFDWLAREGWIIISWWLLVTLAGAAVLPLCTRVLGSLPDRGYTLARAVGLLLVGLVFWLLASVGFLKNTSGSIVLSWGLVLMVSLVLYAQGERLHWRAWWRENARLVITAEVLFAVLFLGWAIVRAHQNGIFATEKPMDLAMMSAVQRSADFPPSDPWMSGYAISYYYFGYLMAAMLSKMSGIASTVGFNMTISLLFALTGLTAFGVVYNLVQARISRTLMNATDDQAPTTKRPAKAALLTGLLGTVFVVLLGNFELPLVDAPYNARIAATGYLEFWQVNERLTPLPSLETGPRFDISAWQGWWWFRAARALNDFNLDGSREEVIDEFPQFSYLLADVHPHVMALPFAALALGLALNIVLAGHKPQRAEMLLYAVCIGGQIFLNTWDGPIYLLILVAAEGLRRYAAQGRLLAGDWLELVGLGLVMAGLSVGLVLPFLIGFRSQLGGVLPNIIYPTSIQQYFLMFGPFILLLMVYLFVEARRAGQRMNWGWGLQVAGGIFLVLLVAMLAFTLLGMLLPSMRSEALSYIENNGGWGAVLPAVVGKRLENLPTTLLLLVGIIFLVGRLVPRGSQSPLDESNSGDTVVMKAQYPPSTGYVLLLVGAGILLSLIPEFVYLRDNFGTRMNTIFKFYYQAWLIFSVASAYAVYSVLADAPFAFPGVRTRSVFSVILGVVLVLGLAYPVFGIYSRMFIETGRSGQSEPAALTLDGGHTIVADDDYGAIVCLSQLVKNNDAVAVEAVGSSYHIEQGGRIGAIAGIPIVLGWEGHEGQWRGVTYGETAGSRRQDIGTLYTDLRWEVAQRVIDKYKINYVMYGTSERSQFGDAGEEKFAENLEVVCQQGNTKIYRVGSQQTAASAGNP